MMAEVELNHPNTSNNGTHTTAERRCPPSDNMQRSSVPLRHHCSGRLFQSSCAGLLPEAVQCRESSYFWLALIMSFLHFSPPRDTLGLSSQSIRGSSQDQTWQKKCNQQTQLASHPGKQIQAPTICNKGHFVAFTQSRETRNRGRRANTQETFCWVRITTLSYTNSSGWRSLADQLGAILWENVPIRDNVMTRKTKVITWSDTSSR